MRFHDTYFIEMLRDELGDESLDITWDPSLWHVDGSGSGGWQVVSRGCFPNRREVVGKSIAFTDERDGFVYGLDGQDGWPKVPGRWLIEILAESDVTRHGFWNRLRHLDDIREGRVILKQKAKQKVADDLKKNTDAFRAMRELAREMGTEAPLREELAALEAKAVANLENYAKMEEYERKDARLYDPDTRLHVTEQVKFVAVE